MAYTRHNRQLNCPYLDNWPDEGKSFAISDDGLRSVANKLKLNYGCVAASSLHLINRYRDTILVNREHKKATMISMIHPRPYLALVQTLTIDTPKKHETNNVNKNFQTYNHTVSWKTERTEKRFHR